MSSLRMALWTVEKMSHFVLADVAGGLRGRFLSDGLRGCADGFRAETVFDAGRGAPDIYAEHRREVGRETEGVFHVRSSLPKRSDYGSSCRRLVPERVDGEPRGQRILCAMPMGRAYHEVAVLAFDYRSTFGRRRSAHGVARYRGKRAVFPSFERSEDIRRVCASRRQPLSKDCCSVPSRARHSFGFRAALSLGFTFASEEGAVWRSLRTPPAILERS